MSRNGSGTYSRAVSAYVYGTIISQTDVNAEMDDIATALTASLAKDGQTTPTANLPMGTYRHTGVGAAAARTDYARASQVQDGDLTELASVAGTNTVTATAPISLAAYAVGQVFQFVPANTNTGAVTLNLSSIGAGAVQLRGKALVGSELVAGVPVTVFVTATTPVFEIIGNGAFLMESIRTDIASATTLDLNAVNGRSLNVTGTTATTGITLADGATRILRAAAAWPITHGASLICPGATSYTCAAGDIVLAIGEPAGVVRLAIWKADGTAVVSSGSAKLQDFRLTLTTGLPVTTADVTGATTIYACPYNGNQISLYSGSAWVTRSSAEFSLALGTLTSAKPYDVFCYDNAGTPTLEFLVWTNDTTRATALAYQDGVLVKSGATTRRYLGTFYTTSTTQTSDAVGGRYLWNYYHRIPRKMKAVDATDSWSYSTAAYRQANGSTANQLNFIVGVAEDVVTARVAAIWGGADGTARPAKPGIGVDSTSVNGADMTQLIYATSSQIMACAAFYTGTPSAGRHYLAWLEYGNASGGLFYGDNAVSTGEQAGISGEVFA